MSDDALRNPISRYWSAKRMRFPVSSCLDRSLLRGLKYRAMSKNLERQLATGVAIIAAVNGSPFKFAREPRGYLCRRTCQLFAHKLWRTAKV